VVIAPTRLLTALRRGLGDDVVCLSARDAKGLEFDVVVLVTPADIAREDGGAALYVAMTRATSQLVVLRRAADR
jgi:DNA helicase IV